MGIRRKIRSLFFNDELVEHLVHKINNLEEKIDTLSKKEEYLFWLSNREKDESMQDTKKRVFASLPKATGTLRDIQLAENAILRRVKDICDKNNLQMALISGTALGAVRHGGFIPWDDDIDIGMPEEDYLTLERILENDDVLESHRYYSPNGHSMYKVKFRLSKEIYIDIFTYERFEATKENAKERWEESQKASKAIQQKIHDELIIRGLDKEARVRPVYNDAMLKCIEEYKQELCKDMPYYGHGNYIALNIALGPGFRDNSWYYPENEVYPLEKGVIEFEGTRYDLWKNLDEFFLKYYGDIWSFPNDINQRHQSEFQESVKEDIAKLKELHII